MKKGLVLEGGGMRGMFTAGVMDVLMENGVKFDGAIGVSAGAAFGCNYKSGQIGRVIRYNTKYIRDKRYCGMRVWLKTGDIFSTDFCYGEIPLVQDVFDFDAYRKNPMVFYVVCTDIETGKPVYHKYEGYEDSGFDWIRASASLPFVSHIVEIDGKKLLDGGMTDSIPVRYFQNIGYEKNVVVLTQPKGYVKKKSRLKLLLNLKYKKYPKLIEAIENRYKMYNETLEYIEKQENSGKIFVIRPEEAIEVKRVEKDSEKLRRAYESGRLTASRCVGDIKKYLSE